MKKVKIGQRVTIVGNSISGHGIKIGQVVIVTAVGQGYVTVKDTNRTWTVYEADYAVELSKDSLLSQLKDLESDIALIKSHLSYLEVTGKTTASLAEIQIYHTLQVLKDATLDDVQKSEIVAKLINQV